MAEEVYDGAVGIDLGKYFLRQIAFTCVVFLSPSVAHPPRTFLNFMPFYSLTHSFNQQERPTPALPHTRETMSRSSPTSRVASPLPHLSLSPTRSGWLVRPPRTRLPWTPATPSSMWSQYSTHYSPVHIHSPISGWPSVLCYRRLIGRPFDDPIVKKDIESWPFKVVDQNKNPMVQVEYLGETKTFSPQEISAMVLTKVCNATLPRNSSILS